MGCSTKKVRLTSSLIKHAKLNVSQQRSKLSMQELKFELFELIKKPVIGDQIIECSMIVNESFVPSWVVMSADDEIFQHPVSFNIVLNEHDDEKNSFKCGYSCSWAKQNEDGIVVKNSTIQKQLDGDQSFGLLNSVTLSLNKISFNNLIKKIDHFNGLILSFPEDSFEQVDDYYFFNQVVGDVISFEIILSSYEDLQNEIIELNKVLGQIRIKEFKQQLDKKNSVVFRLRRFFGI